MEENQTGELPLPELLEWQPVRETLSADTDTFQDTVAMQLVKDKLSTDLARFLGLIGDDATNKVGLRLVESAHQFVEGVLSIRHKEHNMRIARACSCRSDNHNLVGGLLDSYSYEGNQYTLHVPATSVQPSTDTMQPTNTKSEKIQMYAWSFTALCVQSIPMPVIITYLVDLAHSLELAALLASV